MLQYFVHESVPKSVRFRYMNYFQPKILDSLAPALLVDRLIVVILNIHIQLHKADGWTWVMTIFLREPLDYIQKV